MAVQPGCSGKQFDLAIDLGLPFKSSGMKWFAIAADRQCDNPFR